MSHSTIRLTCDQIFFPQLRGKKDYPKIKIDKHVNSDVTSRHGPIRIYWKSHSWQECIDCWEILNWSGKSPESDFFICSLRKQPTKREVATRALAKLHLSNESRNSILMTCHYPDLGSASDWVKREGISFQPIRNFYARYSDVVLRGLNWRPRETSAVFSGYHLASVHTNRHSRNEKGPRTKYRAWLKSSNNITLIIGPSHERACKSHQSCLVWEHLDEKSVDF